MYRTKGLTRLLLTKPSCNWIKLQRTYKGLYILLLSQRNKIRLLSLGL